MKTRKSATLTTVTALNSRTLISPPKPGQNTILFLDDHGLSIRQNIRRGIGRPAPVEGSVWHGDPRLNPAWGYPSVYFDAAAGVWRMLYQASVVKGIRGFPWCKLVAESADGLQWTPVDTRRLVKVPNRQFINQVADGNHEWSGLLVQDEAPADERLLRAGTQDIWASGDGIDWKPLGAWRNDACDLSAFPFFNHVLKRRGLIARQSRGDRRMCLYETADWKSFSDPFLVMQADAMDAPLTDSYGLAVVPYEHLFVGFLWLYHGPNQAVGWNGYKYTGGKVHSQIAYSMNGITWTRSQRDAFIPNGEPGAPDSACVYPSSVVTRPDTQDLWIYASASNWEHGYTPKNAGCILAYRLRRDGFAFLESEAGPGLLATKPLYWKGGGLRLNVQGQGGRAETILEGELLTNGVRVQITDSRAVPLEGFSFKECSAFAGDSTAWTPKWKSGRTMDELEGRAIQIQVQLNNARIYAIRGNFHPFAPRELAYFDEEQRIPVYRPGF